MVELTEQLKWSNTDLNKAQKSLGYLNNIILKNDSYNVNEIFEQLTLLISLIPLNKVFFDDGYFIRCRKNEVKDFNEVCDISYNKRNIDAIQFGRFNYPKTAMFYGAIPNGNPQMHVAISAALEHYKELIIENKSEYVELTFSKWEINVSFEMIDLCFNTINNETPNFNENINKRIEEIKSASSFEISEVVLGFWKFISDISLKPAKSQLQYYFTNLLFEALYNRYNSADYPMHGLVYPSSITDGKGTNIVLLPPSSDILLKPKSVMVFGFHKDSENRIIDCCQISEEAEIADEKFTIKRF